MLQVICAADDTTQKLIQFLLYRCGVTKFNSTKPYLRGEPTIIVGKQYGEVFTLFTGEEPTHGALKNKTLYLNDVKVVLRVPNLVPQYERFIRRLVTPVINPTYTLKNISTAEQLDIAVGSFDFCKPISFDIETNGLYWQHQDPKILCVVLAQLGQYTKCNTTIALCIDGLLLHRSDAAHTVLKWLFKKAQCLIAHNAAFDTAWLDALLHIDAEAHFDTMLMAFQVQGSVYRYSNGLKQLTEQFFNVEDYSKPLKPYITGAKNKGVGFANVPYDMLAQYAAKDVVYTALLYEQLRPHCDYQMYMLLYHNRYSVYTQLNRRGLSIDWQLVQKYKTWLTAISTLHLSAIHREAGKELNPHSPKQLKEYLYDELKLPVQYNKDKKVTTDNKALQILIDRKPDLPVLVLLGQYRKLKKVLGTYIAGIERLSNIGHTKMHESFKHTATISGRVGSEVLLLLPRAATVWGKIVKSCLKAKPGYTFVQADVSQLEVRVMAYLSQDKKLIQAYQQGLDIHGQTAQAIYGDGYTKEQRSWAKGATFSNAYGGTATTLQRNLGISLQAARELYTSYLEEYSGVAVWIKKVHTQALADGYLVNEMGRRLDLGLITDKNVRSLQRLVQNWLIQSFGSDIVQVAVEQLVQSQVPVVLTVHDSVIAEVPIEKAEQYSMCIVEILEKVGNKWLASTEKYPMAVPFVVDVEKPTERLAAQVEYNDIKDALLYDELWEQMIEDNNESIDSL